MIKTIAAVFYVAVGDSFETFSIEANFKPHRFAGNVLAGCSADSRAWSGRADDRIEGFVGEIDEVRVFSIPLTGDQVRFLANRGGTAYRPSPAMGEEVLTSKIALQWAPMPAAKQFDVYVGDNHLSVAEATRTSPAYQATVTKPSYLLNDLDQGTYYWRIDCADESATLQGPVWQFQVQAAGDEAKGN